MQADRSSNDDPRGAKALIAWLFNDATKSLVKGGCICCCCSGGGGKDLAFADWTQMMVAVPHLRFKQVIVWDKGPMGMGMGLHFRPSYEVILDAQRKGARCKWYDKTRKVENIIRPGQYSIYKIIPERRPASNRKASGTGRALHRTAHPAGGISS